MKRLVITLSILFSMTPSAGICLSEEIDKKLGCKNNPKVVGKCIAVHGRVSMYNGTPGVRIWPVGTKRLLGVLPSENEIMPEQVRQLLALDTRIFGDFLLCPFSEPSPASMQFVCIEEASNLVIERCSEGDCTASPAGKK
jgi:hypothetical protein